MILHTKYQGSRPCCCRQEFFSCFPCTRGDQKVCGKKLPFLHRLINRAGITAHNTAKHMQFIGYSMRDVRRLRVLLLSSRQRYIAQSGPFYVAF